uniref:Murine leukemia virus integrase C-terminal domain-containing protein n=1 Tax=Geospiza parvula TaxID=87175 RepID=A0A8U8C706_GEOPR
MPFQAGQRHSLPEQGLDGPVHNIQLGDCVYVKTLTGKTLEPQWERPFQVLLTSFTAVKTEEQASWIHHTRIKKAPQSSWKVTQVHPGKFRRISEQISCSRRQSS